jgi:hypothetical protein
LLRWTRRGLLRRRAGTRSHLPLAARSATTPHVSDVAQQETQTLERFWRWLKDHADCILRANTATAYLYDQEDLHWNLVEEEDGKRVIQLKRGKQFIGELVLDPAEALFVQSAPDTSQPDHFVFDVIGGSRDDADPVLTLILAHGPDRAGEGSGALKH